MSALPGRSASRVTRILACAFFLAIAAPCGADEIKPLPPPAREEPFPLPSVANLPTPPMDFRERREFTRPSSACDACILMSVTANSAVLDYEKAYEAHVATFSEMMRMRRIVDEAEAAVKAAEASQAEAARAVGLARDSPWLVERLEQAKARVAAAQRALRAANEALMPPAKAAAEANKALDEADRNVTDAIRELEYCNRSRCGDPRPSRIERFPEFFGSGGMSSGRSRERPAYPFPRSDCDACVLVRVGVESAIAAVNEAVDVQNRAVWNHRTAIDRLDRASVELKVAESARAELERLIESALNRSPELYPRRAELDARVSAARNAYEAASKESAVTLAAQRAADKALDEAMGGVPGMLSMLDNCNQTRCRPTFVELGSVTGVIGNNPFEPSDPTGPKIVTGQPPVPGAIGSLQLSSASYGGGEGGAVLVMVMRVGGSAGNVSVSYATTPGTASQADFAAASGTLTWRDGDLSSKSFSIALTDDTQVEQTESFTVALSAPTGGAALGSPSTATITIADNDSVAPPQPAGAIQFSASSFTVAENAGSVTITATRTGGSAGEVTVQYFTGPSSAVGGSDYQAVSGVLTWGVGDMGAKSFMVPIINDTLVEGPETFFVTLNNPTGGATLGAPATATVTINDDDVNQGPCGATGSAWTPNAGQYACSGSCVPNPSPRLSINGDLVTATNFHGAPTPATFQGCSQSLTSREGNLTYFGQNNHRATITRSSDANFIANIVSSGGGTCNFTCSRTGP